MYDQRNDVELHILFVFSILKGDICPTISYGVNIFQLIWFVKVTSHVALDTATADTR